MPNSDRDRSQPRTGETSAVEHDRVRSSNDVDQEAEREGIDSGHSRGYDEAARGSSSEEAMSEDVDPDSARSDVDRDDTIDER